MSLQGSLFEAPFQETLDVPREAPAIVVPPAPVLRKYQLEAINGGGGYPGILPALEGARSALLVMATGTGKTTVFGEVARTWPGRVLILAHRDELIHQAADRLRLMTGEHVCVEKAGSYARESSRLVVGCVPTMQRQRLAEWKKDHFGLVVVDEAHHVIGKTYQNIIDHFGGAKILGVTATPDRSDRLALGKVFEEVAYVYDIVDAINDGHLVPVKWDHIDVQGLDLDKVGTVAGDLNQGQLDEQMSSARVLEGVCNPSWELAAGRQMIGFTTSVSAAHAQAKIYNAKRFGCAIAVDASTDPKERTAIMAGFRRGDFQILCNVGIATEGFDAPSAAVVSIGRPTKSRSLFVQMVGRVLRPFEGKDHGHILTFGASGKHELATPLSILGGRYSDDEVDRAKKILRKQKITVGEALTMARQLINEEEAKKRAAKQVKHIVTSRDPFVAFKVDKSAVDRDDWQFGAQPATEKQRAAIEKLGLDVSGLTKRGAGRIMDKVSKGPPSESQRKVLIRAGLPTTVTRKEAGQLITVLVQHNWRAPANIYQLAGIKPR